MTLFCTARFCPLLTLVLVAGCSGGSTSPGKTGLGGNASGGLTGVATGGSTAGGGVAGTGGSATGSGGVAGTGGSTSGSGGVARAGGSATGGGTVSGGGGGRGGSSAASGGAPAAGGIGGSSGGQPGVGTGGGAGALGGGAGGASAIGGSFTLPGTQGSATIYRDDTTATALFAASEADQAMQNRGYTVTEVPLTQIAAASSPVNVVIAVATPDLLTTLQAQGATTVGALKAQAFSIRITKSGSTTWYWALGGDATGAMYGGIELAERIRLDGVSGIASGDHSPYIQNRGIKFNFPIDVRTPSYSDDGDAAWNNVEVMWDMQFWKDFLDDLARHRYNAISLWTLGLFPSMVKVPGYEDVSLSDVKKNTIVFSSDLVGNGMAPTAVLNAAATVETMTIDQKIAFWQQVMQYGKDRGVDFYVITWNVFTFGTQGLHGITQSQTSAATKAYFRAATQQMLVTYPLLAGFGMDPGEAMTNPGKEAWLYDTYGLGIQDALKTQPNRQFRLITRLNQTSVSALSTAFSAYTGQQDFSDKYSQAHMYSSATPHFVDATVNAIPAGKKLWLEVRNDDIYLSRWGDPDYARAYITNMPPASKLAGFFMGPDGYIWGREFVSTEPDSPRQLIIKKQWYSFMLWGRLSYEPTIPSTQFTQIVAIRFPAVDGTALYDAWASVSKILPLVTQFHWSNNQMDYSWYPEACIGQSYHDINNFMTDGTFAGSNIMDIPSYTAAVSAGKATTGTTPLDVAAQLQSFATVGLQRISGMSPGTDKELRLTLGDITAMAYLGQYYAEKILGATNLSLYQATKDATKKTAAVQHLTAAAAFWRSYANQSLSQYKPQILTRMKQTPVDFNSLTSSVDNDVTIAGK